MTFMNKNQPQFIYFAHLVWSNSLKSGLNHQVQWPQQCHGTMVPKLQNVSHDNDRASQVPKNGWPSRNLRYIPMENIFFEWHSRQIIYINHRCLCAMKSSSHTLTNYEGVFQFQMGCACTYRPVFSGIFTQPTSKTGWGGSVLSGNITSNSWCLPGMANLGFVCNSTTI